MLVGALSAWGLPSVTSVPLRLGLLLEGEDLPDRGSGEPANRPTKSSSGRARRPSLLSSAPVSAPGVILAEDVGIEEPGQCTSTGRGTAFNGENASSTGVAPADRSERPDRGDRGGDEADRRGRRSRRRRNRGRGFPDSKYASSDASRPPRFTETAPAAEPESLPLRPPTPRVSAEMRSGSTEFSVLPNGESLSQRHIRTLPHDASPWMRAEERGDSRPAGGVSGARALKHWPPSRKKLSKSPTMHL